MRQRERLLFVDRKVCAMARNGVRDATGSRRCCSSSTPATARPANRLRFNHCGPTENLHPGWGEVGGAADPGRFSGERREGRRWKRCERQCFARRQGLTGWGGRPAVGGCGPGRNWREDWTTCGRRPAVGRRGPVGRPGHNTKGDRATTQREAVPQQKDWLRR